MDRYNQYLDDFIEFPGFPGLPEQEPKIEQIPHFLQEIQAKRFDLAVQMQGSGRFTNLLIELFGAGLTAGFTEPGKYAPEKGNFMLYPHGIPEIRRHLKLMEHLGIPSKGEGLEFPLTVKDWEDFHFLERKFGFKAGEYVVIHAGSRKPERRWPLWRFTEVGEKLLRQGLTIVLTGTAEEAGLTTELGQLMRSQVVDLAGMTSLGSLGALLKAARLTISNDTGVAHMADALQVPSVVLFSAPDHERWAPLDKELHRVITGAGGVSSASVLAEVEDLLEKESTYANE